MTDLRPYICTVKECPQANETFGSIKDYLKHEITTHEVDNVGVRTRPIPQRAKESITCIFCGMQTAWGKGPHSRGRHVGQHLEEIAFIVVPTAYEDWAFYSDSTSDASSFAPDPTQVQTTSGDSQDDVPLQLALGFAWELTNEQSYRYLVKELFLLPPGLDDQEIFYFMISVASKQPTMQQMLDFPSVIQAVRLELEDEESGLIPSEFSEFERENKNEL